MSSAKKHPLRRKILTGLGVYIIGAFLMWGWLVNHIPSKTDADPGGTVVVSMFWPITVPVLLSVPVVKLLGQVALFVTRWP